MTHLILHKVRGEPAFDVAELMENGWWIIPTSGHRAYPIQKWHLEDLTDVSTDEPICPNNNLTECTVPAEWPDHYEAVDDRAIARKGEGLDIWSIFKRPEPKLLRRRV